MSRSFRLRSAQLPECCGVTVLGRARLPTDFGERGLVTDDADGFAKHLMGLIDPANQGCYLYTTTCDQKAEYNALNMAGFKVIGRFKNPRTGNWVLIHAWTKTPLPSKTKTVRGPRIVGTGRATTRRRTTTKRRTLSRSR